MEIWSSEGVFFGFLRLLDLGLGLDCAGEGVGSFSLGVACGPRDLIALGKADD